MSVAGHEPPRRSLAGAAERPPTPDTKVDGRRGGSGPLPDSGTVAKASLFDHLVGALKEAGGDFLADDLRRLQVDNEFK